jgi:hypothetical protein
VLTPRLPHLIERENKNKRIIGLFSAHHWIIDINDQNRRREKEAGID